MFVCTWREKIRDDSIIFIIVSSPHNSLSLARVVRIILLHSSLHISPADDLPRTRFPVTYWSLFGLRALSL